MLIVLVIIVLILIVLVIIVLVIIVLMLIAKELAKFLYYTNKLEYKQVYKNDINYIIINRK